MTTGNADFGEGLRHAFKHFNRFMLLMWRLGLGSWFNFWPEVSGRVLVISHVGRKTGIRRCTPLNFAVVDGEIYCIAGFGPIADWYRNVMASPEVEVWLPDGWWAGLAEDVSDSEARIPLIRAIMIASGFAAPLFGLHPTRMTDDEIAMASANYRLIRIRRTEARTGTGGPGDLAWVWPLVTMILLPLVALRRRR
jgi:deazaflavin-dependent oxidoreductase (nitroreductase family)